MPETYVIDLTNKTKDAALYFDWVVPLSFGIDPKSRSIQSISPRTLYTSDQIPQPCTDYLQAIEALHAATYFRIAEYPEDEQRHYREEFAQKAIRMIEVRPELHEAFFLLPDDDPFPGVDTDSEFRASLIGLSLIDTEKASWDQIIEFRRDKKSRMALRRLQIFFDKEYVGKSRAFIEDDLLLRLEAYNNAVRDWGFETRAATISNLINSKVLLAGLSGAVLSSLFGAHWMESISAGAGIAIELGNLTIDLAKRRYSLATLRRDHPLSFIISAHAQLAGRV